MDLSVFGLGQLIKPRCAFEHLIVDFIDMVIQRSFFLNENFNFFWNLFIGFLQL